MIAYLVRRIIGLFLTILMVLILTFFMIRLAPGGPFESDRPLPAVIYNNLNALYHLNEPLWWQLVHYINGVLHGDLGPSLQTTGYSVMDLIRLGLPVSLKIGIASWILIVLVGGGLGTYMALTLSSTKRTIMLVITTIGSSLPSFVAAPLLTLTFGVSLHLLPVGGWKKGHAEYLILPILSMSLPYIFYLARLVHASICEVMESSYIFSARARGIPPRLIFWRHALRPSLLPVISYLGPTTGHILTGSIIVERIYSLPGIGKTLVYGALNRDYTVVIGVVLVYSLTMILCNFLVPWAMFIFHTRKQFFWQNL
jgi:oligopeptide transport system permease protein